MFTAGTGAETKITPLPNFGLKLMVKEAVNA